MTTQHSNGKLVNRRRFLIASGGVLAASMLACGGTLALATTPTPALDYGSVACGKEIKMQKILVAYASRCGSTAEVAQAVAEELCKQGLAADVHSVDQVTTLAGYDGYVVGSAIRMGQWLPAAVDFVKGNQAVLQQKPVAFFTVHMLNVDDSPESKANRAAYVASVHALVEPAAEAFFAGQIDPQRLSFLDRMMVKMVKSPVGDFRNWDKIRGWADQFATQEGVLA